MLMAASLPRLWWGSSPQASALGEALRATIVGAFTPEERDWATRISSWRKRAADSETPLPTAGFEDGATTPEGLAGEINRPILAEHLVGLLGVPEAWGGFQMRLVRRLTPRSVLELGTGVGVSAAYISAGLELAGGGELISLDGARAWSAYAGATLQQLELAHHVELRVGAIDEILPEALAAAAPIDYAFLDADHSQDATVRHFEAVREHLAPGAVVVLDDITFNRDMWRGWQGIRKSRGVAISVSLGRVGVLVME